LFYFLPLIITFFDQPIRVFFDMYNAYGD